MNTDVNTFVELAQISGREVPATTSLKVAEYFEKNHRDVLRDVREIIDKCSQDFTERNFALSGYTDPTGRKLPMYLLTRDGFTMVAMGYTGEKAMQFKERYIAAFNEMEEALRNREVEVSAAKSVSVERLRALREFYTVDCKAAGTQATRAIDRAWRRIEGISPLEIGGILLKNESDEDLLNYRTVTEIGKLFGLSAVKLNTILTGLGLQEAIQKFKKVKNQNGELEEKPAGFDYKPTALGEQHGGKRISDSAANNVNKEVWNLKWHKDKLPAYLREVYFKDEEEQA